MVYRRIYRTKRNNISDHKRDEILKALYAINERCASIVDYLRNEIPNNPEDKQEQEVRALAEKQIFLIRWLEDAFEGVCTEHRYEPEIVQTNSGRDKTILVCQNCGKELKRITNDLKKQYNL
jgi:hypothetical protein